VTSDSGRAILQAEAENLPKGVPGVRFGLYKVRIAHPDREIPTRYGAETVLGFEVSPLERTGDSKEFRLTGR
jgi:hypothetical protein